MLVLLTTLLIASASPPDPAAEAPPAIVSATSTGNESPEAPATKGLEQGDAKKLDASELGELRAGDDTSVYVITDQTLTAVNSGNSVVGEVVGSGAVTLSENAFSGYNGIGNFVINTGHNNNLQGSISVSIATTPQ